MECRFARENTLNVLINPQVLWEMQLLFRLVLSALVVAIPSDVPDVMALPIWIPLDLTSCRVPE